MTCIAGLLSGGKVYLAADSLVSDAYGSLNTTSPFDKIVRKSTKDSADTLLIGFAGSIRGAQILQYHVELPDRPSLMPPQEYLVTMFIPALRQALVDHGSIFVKNGEQLTFTDLLIAFSGGFLFEMDGDFQIRGVDSYAAIGSGYKHAMGSLFSTDRKAPAKRVRKAVEAAAEFDAGVGGKIIVKVL